MYCQLRIDWQHCFIGPDVDEVDDIIELEDGYFILGSYAIPVVNPLIIRQSDVWLIKTDFEGNMIWDKKFGGTGDDFGRRILKTLDNNFIIVSASFSSDMDLENNPYPNSGNYWIYKINPQGEIIWNKIVGGNGTDVPINATITSDGGVIVIGRTVSNDGDVSVSYGSWDAWAIKLDVNGNKTWEYSIGTGGLEWSNDILELPDGGVLIGGTSAEYGSGNIDCDSHSAWGESLLTKLNSNLNLEWQTCYGGSMDEAIMSLVKVNGGYIIAHCVSSNDGDLSISGYHGGETDVWVTKIDTVGNLIWGKCFGGTKIEISYHILSEANGDLTLFGYTSSNDGTVNGNHSQGNDIWVFKIDSLGNLKWQQCLGGTGMEIMIKGVIKTGNGYVIAGCTFGSFATGDINCNTTAATSDDIWFFKVTDTTTVSSNQMNTSRLKIYPNPASDYLIITDDDQTQKIFSLKNIYGKELVVSKMFTSELLINLESFCSGIYIYTIKNKAGGFTAGKIIVN